MRLHKRPNGTEINNYSTMNKPVQQSQLQNALQLKSVCHCCHPVEREFHYGVKEFPVEKNEESHLLFLFYL